MINTHPDTGVAYGLVSSNDLDPELVDTLMYGPQATDQSYEDALANYLNEHLTDSEDEDEVDRLEETFSNQYEAHEPTVTGAHEGVTYATCWLGGALSFWILESPHIGEGSRPSPCVPGACILHHPDDGKFNSTEGYTVPADWWEAREVHA